MKNEKFQINNPILISLTLGVAYQEINLKLINKHVFKDIKILILLGIIYNIETNLFQHFIKIKTIFSA